MEYNDTGEPDGEELDNSVGKKSSVTNDTGEDEGGLEIPGQPMGKTAGALRLLGAGQPYMSKNK